MTSMIQMERAFMVSPTKRDWNHSPNSSLVPRASSCASISVMTLLISMEVFPMMTPALLFTTLCPTSKIPMTIFHVFVTMRTAQKVLKIHRSSKQRIFRSGNVEKEKPP